MDMWIEKLSIRPVTKRLVTCFWLDVPVIPAVGVDFGLDSPNHYRALKEVLFGDEGQPEQTMEEAQMELHRRILEVEEALGNGVMLNRLVKKYAPQYAQSVYFETAWDVLWGRTKKFGF